MLGAMDYGAPSDLGHMFLSCAVAAILPGAILQVRGTILSGAILQVLYCQVQYYRCYTVRCNTTGVILPGAILQVLYCQVRSIRLLRSMAHHVRA